MDRIKTEPDPDAEVYSASCSEIQLVDVKQEEQPVSISFPAAKDGKMWVVNVSVANGVQQWRPAGDLFGTCLYVVDIQKSCLLYMEIPS